MINTVDVSFQAALKAGYSTLIILSVITTAAVTPKPILTLLFLQEKVLQKGDSIHLAEKCLNNLKNQMLMLPLCNMFLCWLERMWLRCFIALQIMIMTVSLRPFELVLELFLVGECVALHTLLTSC